VSTRDYAVLWLNVQKGGVGATAFGGTALLTTPQHKLDGPEHLTADDTTDKDATTTEHGLLPKLSGDSGDALRGDGTWGAVTGSVIAADVSVADAGGYFTATDVEAALQELAKKDIGYVAHGNTGSTETFDALTGWHSATLDANCTVTFTGATSGLVAAMVLELKQDGTGSKLVTWPGAVVWPGGTAPTLSTAANATDLLMFFSRDGGTTWFGFMSGGGGTGSALTVKDEGTNLDTAVTSFDFVGAWVVATHTGHAVTVTVASRALDDLTDVTITSPATADRLRYSGTEWVNSALIWTPLTAFDGTDWLPLVDGDGNSIMAEA
jgi:hypothetical protein